MRYKTGFTRFKHLRVNKQIHDKQVRDTNQICDKKHIRDKKQNK